MANEIYLVRGSSIVWTDSGGDEELDIGGGDCEAGEVLAGSYYDRGASAGPDEYEWVLHIDGFDATPVPTESFDLYFAQSNATASGWDGEMTAPNDSADTALTDVDLLDNMMYAGSAVVFHATAADELIARGVVRFTSRYFCPVLHNNTADNPLTTADAHTLTLTPIYYQGQ